MIFEYIWFFLWGLLWAIYFMTDGFDLGLGTLMPFLGKTEEDKRVMVTSMGPLWDGNEVWLLTAGGVTFAAQPRDYSQKVNRKMYRGALQAILSELVRQDRLIAIDSLDLSEPKTKALAAKLALELV